MWFHFSRVQLPADQEPCQFVWTLPVGWMGTWQRWTLHLQQLYPLAHQTWFLILLARASSIVHRWLWSGPILSCKCWMMASSSKIYFLVIWIKYHQSNIYNSMLFNNLIMPLGQTTKILCCLNAYILPKYWLLWCLWLILVRNSPLLSLFFILSWKECSLFFKELLIWEILLEILAIWSLTKNVGVSFTFIFLLIFFFQ